MFNFIKKAGTGVTSDKDEKEKRKRDKKDRKDKQKRERASMSAEELLRLDEVCTARNLFRIIIAITGCRKNFCGQIFFFDWNFGLKLFETN